MSQSYLLQRYEQLYYFISIEIELIASHALVEGSLMVGAARSKPFTNKLIAKGVS